MVRKLIVGSLLASLVLSLVGCDSATMGAPGNTTLSSAAVGGLSGAGLGAALNEKNRASGALIGAGVGTLAGGLLGQQMEKNRDRAQQQPPPPGPYGPGYMGPQQAPPPPRTY